MYYLFASKQGKDRRLAATFDSEQQLLAYVRWATLENYGDGKGKFEQGSVLAGYDRWEPLPESPTAAADDLDAADVPHNPSPTML